MKYSFGQARRLLAIASAALALTMTAAGTASAVSVDTKSRSVSASTAELSGPGWAGQFPSSASLSVLSKAFGSDVTRFINAMTNAGIKVHVIATLRPPQRAYLMHYSWLIAKGQLSAAQVPPFNPINGQQSVGIRWVHSGATGAFDPAASVTAAGELLRAFGVDPALKVPPGLQSLHSEGLAIDMTTTWKSPTVVIVNGSGARVTIRSTPHNSLNARLIAVGATYGVVHFLTAANDPNHWSINGH